jgi:bifunctional UDP-N-acetylglucosamine pyrophosphorylase/glucosamine-1-phosphate N-acetyltransferase
MHSRLPKVLQPLAGKALLQHVIDTSVETGADDICIVTGHAVQQAMPDTPNENLVLILYGDVPLLKVETLKRLLDSCGKDECAVLTVDMDDPYGYGRIVRENGSVVRNVEEKDATDEERKINEINSGVMVCPAGRLRTWLGGLDNDNSQGEYYLTDVIGLAVGDGCVVHGVKADSWVEVMGINNGRCRHGSSKNS